MPPLRVGKACGCCASNTARASSLRSTLTRLRHAPIAVPTSCAPSPSMAQHRVDLGSLLLRQAGSKDWTMRASANAGSASAHREQRRIRTRNRTGEACVVAENGDQPPKSVVPAACADHYGVRISHGQAPTIQIAPCAQEIEMSRIVNPSPTTVPSTGSRAWRWLRISLSPGCRPHSERTPFHPAPAA
jgi:hypothetical protein